MINWNIKSLCSIAALSCIVGTSLTAQDEVRLRNLENRLTSLEDSQYNCCVINPPARPYPAECWGFYVNIDPFIWQGHVNGLGLAIETSDSHAFFNEKGESHVKNLDFDWDFGFRLGLGLNTNHDAWDILLQWTRWRSDGHRHVATGSDEALFPNVGAPSFNLDRSMKSVHGKWKLDYDILDLENGREFYVSKYLTLRPFGGLRTAWIKQHFHVENGFAEVTSHIHQEDHTWGIGIRGGIDMQWGLGCGFSLFSNYAANLLYSFHDVKHSEDNPKHSGSEGSQALPFHVKDFFHVGNGIFDMQIGVRYDWMSCDCCYHLGFDLGWENHWHPGQNQFLKFVGTDEFMVGNFIANQGDLGIQGAYLKVRFDF